jgi:hypothetical protein
MHQASLGCPSGRGLIRVEKAMMVTGDEIGTYIPPKANSFNYG